MVEIDGIWLLVAGGVLSLWAAFMFGMLWARWRDYCDTQRYLNGWN